MGSASFESKLAQLVLSALSTIEFEGFFVFFSPFSVAVFLLMYAAYLLSISFSHFRGSSRICSVVLKGELQM